MPFHTAKVVRLLSTQFKTSGTTWLSPTQVLKEMYKIGTL